MSRAELLRAAHVERNEREGLATCLASLEARGILVRARRDAWGPAEALGLIAGRLDVNPAGFAFLRRADGAGEDIYVPAKAVRPAMHRDQVLVALDRSRRARPEGKVSRVLERGFTEVVGVFHPARAGGVIVPQEQRLLIPIAVPKSGVHGATEGDMVLATITKYPAKTGDAEAKIVRVLGPAADPRVESEAVILAHGLPLEFPPEVAAAARRVLQVVSPDAIAGRLDLRGMPLVTIDGENARDFDDAVMVEPLGTGFLLTVAVADVAYHVPVGSPLDLEARARGTSVYFPDRVVPMLPEALSNGICSLKAGEDRLCKAVRLEFDARGRLLGAAFHDAIIRSMARLTYTQVRQALVDRDPQVRQQLAPLVQHLERAEALARQLIARRRQRGALDFDLPEAEIVLDLRGKPENIVRAERSIAHQMIEEFMLAANEAVARELARRKLPVIFRVHEQPDAESVRSLARFLEGFGLRLDLVDGRPTSKAYREVLGHAAGRPEERLINTVLLRSLKQARYSTEPLGHFGLATEAYTHFTSPIRRYPDLVTHRLLDFALRNAGRPTQDAAGIAEEASRRERVATEAEREIVQLKKVHFMHGRIGETHDGYVSGVTSFGFFVELHQMFVEGLVHVNSLTDDFYELVEAQHTLRGRRNRRTFRVGDAVKVDVAGVSVERRQINFVLTGQAPPEDKTGGRKRARRS